MNWVLRIFIPAFQLKKKGQSDKTLTFRNKLKTTGTGDNNKNLDRSLDPGSAKKRYSAQRFFQFLKPLVHPCAFTSEVKVV